MARTNLELLVPPPLVLLAAALLMWLVAVFVTPARVAVPYRSIVGWSVFGLGVMIDVIGLVQFRAARTTFNPIKVDATSALVTRGLYAVSRNPMYVGQTLILVAWAVYLQNWLTLAVVAAFVFWLDRFQIAPEERVLESKFGEAFRRYRRSVRRWL